MISEATTRNRRGGRRIPISCGGAPNPIDVHVGRRLRMRRTLLGMSQEKLGEALGVTFQQVQKYERGINRVGASRLHELARVLDVPVAFFYEEMGRDLVERAREHTTGMAEATAQPYERDPMMRRETLELMRAYYKIADPAVRKRIFELVKTIAKAAPSKG